MVLGTHTYGAESTSSQGTLEELTIAKALAKPLLVVQMCDRYKHTEVRQSAPVLQFALVSPFHAKPMPCQRIDAGTHGAQPDSVIRAVEMWYTVARCHLGHLGSGSCSLMPITAWRFFEGIEMGAVPLDVVVYTSDIVWPFG